MLEMGNMRRGYKRGAEGNVPSDRFYSPVGKGRRERREKTWKKIDEGLQGLHYCVLEEMEELKLIILTRNANAAIRLHTKGLSSRRLVILGQRG